MWVGLIVLILSAVVLCELFGWDFNDWISGR